MNASRPRDEVLVRRARLVPVGPGMRAAGSDDRPVDLRITDGMVTEVGPDLPADGVSDVIDAAGRWAVPGLWDHHVHLTTWSRTRTTIDLAGTAGPDEVTRRVAGHLAGLTGERPRLVSGFGYRSGAWDRIGTVAELDAATGDVPVILTSGDAHNGWLNSAALGLLGVAGVTGPLEENDWFGLQPSISAMLEEIEAAGAGDTALRWAMAAAAARGITGVVDLEMPSSYRQWSSRFANGLDLVRVRASVYPDALDGLLAAGIRTGDPLAGDGDLLTMGPFKVISDGSLNTRTARCCDPYPDSGGRHLTRGTQNYDLDEMTALLSTAHAGGL
ncbi:MAG TPA: amidohydrolase family protein, partial [Nakamurella sp.]